MLFGLYLVRVISWIMNIQMNENNYNLAVSHFNSGKPELAKKHALKNLQTLPRDVNTLKLLAFIEYQSSNFPEAIKYLKNIISQNPNIAEINNLMGCIYLKTGEYDKSIEFFSKTIENAPQYIDAYLNLAQVLQRINQPLESIRALQTAYNFSPQSVNVIEPYAALSYALGDSETAVKLYNAWLHIEPTSITANAGLAKSNLSRDREELVTEQLVKLKNLPDKAPMARLDVSNELLQAGKYDMAVQAYTNLLDDFPTKEIIYNNLASAYDRLNNTKKAIECFRRAIEINDRYAPAHLNIGRVYTDILESNLAKKHLYRALELEPNNVNALINIGRLFDNLGDMKKAKQYFERAINLEPNNPIAHSNLGNALHQLGDFNASCQSYKNCLSIDPNYADAEQNLGINELAMGKFDSAWGHYFKRVRNLERGENLSPIIPGMDLSGKHVYFCRSQGIGDEIFFLRFLPTLKKQDVTITYRASKKTYPLLLQLKEIDNLLMEDADIPDCDLYFTIDDLPLILNIDHVSKIPPSLQLTPSKSLIDKAKKILAACPPPYTAITWRAGTQDLRKNIKHNQRHLNKFFPITEFKSIFSSLSGSIIILQRNPELSEIKQLEELSTLPILDMSSWNESLEDMLALLSLINHYIGVSNTNMHLLAALGKTADVLVPFPPDWRWMTEGSESPWFPGFGIFRQSNDGTWNSAVNDLINKVKQHYGH